MNDAIVAELKLEDLPLPFPVYQAVEALWKERNQLREDLIRSSSAQCQIDSYIADLIKQGNTQKRCVDGLNEEVQRLNTRIAALQGEQRDLKRSWLAEKNDLQNRFFQIQSLNTQLNGTLIKKEKDFSKLQTHLSKLVAEKERSVKSTFFVCGNKPATLNRTSGSIAELKKIEKIASYSEQIFLRQEIASLRNNLQELQGLVAELKMKLQLATKLEDNRIVDESVVPLSPRSGSIARKYLTGTPGAKPLSLLLNKESCSALTTSVEVEKHSEVILRLQLEEALLVIKEQDRLIHEALINHKGSEQIIFEENEWETEETLPKENIFRDHNVNPIRNAEILPPASPATISLLSSLGWKSLPRLESEFMKYRELCSEKWTEDQLPETLEF